MAYIKYSNGVVNTWDENLAVGTLIRTYYSGYWILERIEFREPTPRPKNADPRWYPELVEWSHEDMKASPVFHFVQVLNDKGEETKKNRKCCCASYCRKIDSEYIDNQHKSEFLAMNAKKAALLKFV